MAGTNQGKAAAPRAVNRDRIIKLGFLVVAGIMVVMIYFWQTSALQVPGWQEDFEEAMARARAQNKKVVALFVRRSPSETARWVASNTLAKAGNQKALADGPFIPVLLHVANTAKDPQASRFGVTDYPSLLLIGPNGWVYNRYTGRVGETDFRHGFLDQATVENPELTGWHRDPEAAIAEATARRAPILIFASGPPQSPEARAIIHGPLADTGVRERIERSGAVLLHLRASDVEGSPQARQLQITELPAMVLALPDGRPLRRIEGPITAAALDQAFFQVPDLLLGRGPAGGE